MDERENVVAIELFAPLQEVEFEDKAQAAHLPVEFFDQFGDGRSGPAGGEHVVDDQHILPRRDGVFVDLKDVGTVFQRILDAFALGRKFLFFTNRDEAVAQSVGDGGRDDEATRFDAEDQVDRAGTVVPGEGVDDSLEPIRVFKQRGDVVEVDAGFWKIGYFADEGFELVHSGGNLYCNLICFLQRRGPRLGSRAQG